MECFAVRNALRQPIDAKLKSSVRVGSPRLRPSVGVLRVRELELVVACDPEVALQPGAEVEGHAMTASLDVVAKVV